MAIEMTAEIKAAIDAAVEDATAGLVSKRDELLAEVKTLRKGKAIDPAEIEKLESQIETLKADNAKTAKELKTATKAAADATEALKSESGFTSQLLIENGLRDELTKNGVTNPALQKAAVAMLKAQGVQVVADGASRVAKVGEKTLDVFVKEFAGSDEGKHFVAAASNSGGGAGGGGSKGEAALKMTRTQFDGLNPGQKTDFSKKGGTLTD